MPDPASTLRVPEAVVVGLGANVGERLAALRAAVEAMAAWPETAVEAASAVYETEAHVRPGTPLQPGHLNAAVRLRTALAPADVLARLHVAERAAGRDASAPPWSPRPLDLDLLLYGDRRIEAPGLVVPHPRLGERRFVLEPLADLDAGLAVPGTDGRTVRDLLRETADRGRILRTRYVLIPRAFGTL